MQLLYKILSKTSFNEFLPIVKNILFHASLKYSKCMLRKQKSHIHKRKKKIKFRIKFEDGSEFHELIFTKSIL